MNDVTLVDPFDYAAPGFYFWFDHSHNLVVEEVTGGELPVDTAAWRGRRLSAESYRSEEEAREALNAMLTARVEEPDFEKSARAARLLLAAGAPVTRRQFIDAILARGL